MSDPKLANRLAVVTGGAQGIGRAIVEELIAQGARVVIADLNGELGNATATEVGASAKALNVTDSTSVAQVVAEIEDELGPIDIWVNNAGICRNAPALEMSDADYKAVVTVNLDGTFYPCREVGKRMVARGKGAIVNIASMSGIISNHPQPQCAYNASKAAVIMLTKSLAGEWGLDGVRVNSVSPGYTATAILDQVTELQPEWTKLWFSETPMGRPGKPAEIAKLVAFLASDDASFITGSNVVIDGGYTCW